MINNIRLVHTHIAMLVWNSFSEVVVTVTSWVADRIVEKPSVLELVVSVFLFGEVCDTRCQISCIVAGNYMVNCHRFDICLCR